MRKKKKVEKSKIKTNFSTNIKLKANNNLNLSNIILFLTFLGGLSIIFINCGKYLAIKGKFIGLGLPLGLIQINFEMSIVEATHIAIIFLLFLLSGIILTLNLKKGKYILLFLCDILLSVFLINHLEIYNIVYTILCTFGTSIICFQIVKLVMEYREKWIFPLSVLIVLVILLGITYLGNFLLAKDKEANHYDDFISYNNNTYVVVNFNSDNSILCKYNEIKNEPDCKEYIVLNNTELKIQKREEET